MIGAVDTTMSEYLIIIAAATSIQHQDRETISDLHLISAPDGTSCSGYFVGDKIYNEALNQAFQCQRHSTKSIRQWLHRLVV